MSESAIGLMDTLTRRVMNPVKEREILSLVIQADPVTQADVIEQLQVEYMTHPVRGNLVEWLLEMYTQQIAINKHSVWDYILSRRGVEMSTVGEEYAYVLDTVMEDSVENTVKHLQDCYVTRTIYYNVSVKAQQDLINNVPIDEIRDEIELTLVNLAEGAGSKRQTLSENAATTLQKILNPSPDQMGKMLGLKDPDEQFCGLNRDTVITIAGFSGSGKTATVCDWIHRLSNAYPTEIAICFFTLEMSEERIIRRLYSRHSGLSEYKMKRHALGGQHTLNEHEVNALLDAYGNVKDYPLELYYESVNAKSLKRRARQFALKHKGKHLFFVLDHLGEVEKTSTDARQETDKAMQAMKDMAKEYDATAIVLSQLKKEVEDKGNRPLCKPNRSHIMESVGVIAKSDILILLWRPEVYVTHMPFGTDEAYCEMWDTSGKQFWLVEKNRDGMAPNDIIIGCDIKTNTLFDHVEHIF